MSTSPRARAVGAALTALSCNALSGAADFELTSRCTGPSCGVCPAGERWLDVDEVCVPACALDTKACGRTCCERGLSCVAGLDGEQRCSLCERAEDICGDKACCEQGATCTDPAVGVCSSPYGTAKQSCDTALLCGADTSCCASSPVPGGTFPRGASASEPMVADDELPETDVLVSSFELDRFEVTVGRFRSFVERWSYSALPPGAGAHPKIPGSGWRAAWNARLPKTRGELENLLASCGPGSTWKYGDDALPINCVTWYEAFAFCAWDGGRLPTETEWEYAAAGGDENRTYPWGNAPPSAALANFGCAYDGVPAVCANTDIAPVGAHLAGAGRWGQLDLAGNMFEYVLDTYDWYAPATSDPASTEGTAARVLRGGAYATIGAAMRSSKRDQVPAWFRNDGNGVRCARRGNP